MEADWSVKTAFHEVPEGCRANTVCQVEKYV